MKRLGAFGAILACAASLSVSLNAQQTPTIDQILAKYVTALGGREAILKQTSRHVKGTAELEGLPAAGTAESYAKAPDKYFATIAFPEIGISKRGYDGQNGWTGDPRNGVQDLTGADLDSMKRLSDMFQALDIRKNYPKLELLASEDVEGKPAYVIQAALSDGSTRKMYFDVASGLMVRTMESTNTPDGEVAISVDYRDYRDAGGVKYPYTVVNRTKAPDGSASSITIHLAEVQTNVPVEDAIFKKPAS